MLGNIQDKIQKIDLDDLNVKQLPELERYILHKVFLLNKNLKENLNNYNFAKLKIC